jgi:hypothetical protein
VGRGHSGAADYSNGSSNLHTFAAGQEIPVFIKSEIVLLSLQEPGIDQYPVTLLDTCSAVILSSI